MTNKEKKQEYCEFVILKSDFKKVLTTHKNFAILKGSTSDVFGLINFKVKDSFLKLTTTDGNQAFQSELQILEQYGSNSEFNLSMKQLAKCSLLKSPLDCIKISSKDNQVTVFDEDFNTSQIFPIYNKVKFPDIDEYIPKFSASHKIEILPSSIKNFSKIKSGKKNFTLSINPNSKERKFILETTQDGLSQKALFISLNNLNSINEVNSI